MDRIASVSVPALPLQLLLRQHPAWRSGPVAVVDRDKSTGAVTWLNRSAVGQGLRIGMRLGVALSLVPKLRAEAVSGAAVATATAEVVETLRRFSPEVEASSELTGVFYVNAAGLGRLYPSLEAWGRTVCDGLGALGLPARVVVGFSRFGTYAVGSAMAGEGAAVRVLADSAAETAALHQVPLAVLELGAKARAQLEKLGIGTVGAFLRLPAESLRRRFAPEVVALHRQAAGAVWRPLVPEETVEPVIVRHLFDRPVVSAQPLMAVLGRALPPLVQRLRKRQLAVAALVLVLCLDNDRESHCRVAPAAPATEANTLLELLGLQLAGRNLEDGVVEMVAEADTVAAGPEDEVLFPMRGSRDLEAAGQALARVRARFGDDAVVRAELRSAHLPERMFEWVESGRCRAATARESGQRPLVRQILAEPHPIDTTGLRPRFGPFVIAGGWWESPMHREYQFAESAEGALLWIFFDRARQRWYQQGQVV